MRYSARRQLAVTRIAMSLILFLLAIVCPARAVRLFLRLGNGADRRLPRPHAPAGKGRLAAPPRDVNRLVENRERLIGALLLGNTFINILASSLTTAALEARLGQRAVAITTGVMTVVILVFAEVLPKTLAIARTDRFALIVARPLRLVVRAAGAHRGVGAMAGVAGAVACSASAPKETRAGGRSRMRKSAARWNCITAKAMSSASIAT